MSFIDFCEIPQANTGSGDQDAFELFASSFLHEIKGMEIISGQSRGADGGKDLLVVEKIRGALTESRKIWLVSCKHFAHSGRSVSDTDEQNITDRLAQHGAKGFLGFYSTVVSSGLNNRFDSIKESYDVAIFNKETIENELIRSSDQILFKRFFPSSFKRWREAQGSYQVSEILETYAPVKCECCGKDLICKDAPYGIVVFSDNVETNITERIYCVCKGACDKYIDRIEWRKGRITRWEDISDFCIPSIYVQKYMAFLNALYDPSDYLKLSKEAFEELKRFLICISQVVLRPQTAEEMQRARDLAMLP